MLKIDILKNETLMDLELYQDEVNTALNVEWDSLYFPHNDKDIASLRVGDNLFTLTTTGNITLLDVDKSLYYTNDNPESILDFLNTLQTDIDRNEERDVIVVSRNQFILVVDRVIDETIEQLTVRFEDHLPFEDIPKNLDELEDVMIDKAMAYMDKKDVASRKQFA